VTARRTIATALMSAAVTGVVGNLPSPAIPGWERVNYRGQRVSLSGGFAAAAGTMIGVSSDRTLRRSALVAAAAALVGGAYDDLLGPLSDGKADKGLAGHAKALRSGRLSGGAAKVAIIGVGSVLAARQLPSSKASRPGLLSSGLSAVLIAGSANLVNLFDLRPGRAGKLTLLVASGAALGGASAGPIAAVIGATIAELPGDLRERTMLGDTGANTLGALVGVRLAAGGRPTRIAALLVIGGLTLASERISFTRVIAAVRPLRWLDELGRVGVRG
jgi:hypothetical protein